MMPQQKKASTNLAQAEGTNSDVASILKTHECMSNLVVLRTILSYLSKSDLMNCRLVNKFWHSEVNSLRHRSNITLKISTEHLLQHIRQLTELIPQMTLRFNGLSFRKFSCMRIPACPRIRVAAARNPNLDEFLQVLPPIKYLHFDDSLASKEVILQILESNANHLEVLSLENCGMSVPNDILKAICILKNLTKFHGTTYPYDYGDRRDWCEIIEKCKSLKSLERITFFDFESIPQNRWHVIKCFDVRIGSRPFDWRPLEKYFQVVPASHRFTSLMIKSMCSSHLPHAKLVSLSLLNSCKQTLTSLLLHLGTVKLQSVHDLCGVCSKLRSLTILGHAQSKDDLESELLGIFPEELLFLRGMNLTAAELRKLQFVPVRPALQHLTGLTQLTIIAFSDQARTTLMYWDSKSNGVNYRQGLGDDASDIIKALSVERMRSLWNHD